MKKIFLVFAAIPLFSACAGFGSLAKINFDWIQTGPNFEPTKGEIEIMANQDNIKKPYNFVGVATVEVTQKTQAAVTAALNKIKKVAAQKGADAVIITQNDNGAAGIVINGFALKYADTVTEKDQKAIEQFNILGPLN